MHTCAFSFAILFILYYTSNLHQRNPVVPDAPINDSDLLPPNANDMKFTETQELVAEFFGIILILFGDGAVAMVVLFGKPSSSGPLTSAAECLFVAHAKVQFPRGYNYEDRRIPGL